MVQLYFAMHIWITHRACANHALLSFFPQRFLQQFRGVNLHLNIFELVINMVALASAVTINTAMRAPAINIHSIMRRENGFNLFKMHFIFLFVKVCKVGKPGFQAFIFFIITIDLTAVCIFNQSDSHLFFSSFGLITLYK
jgi:hypothetical protein